LVIQINGLTKVFDTGDHQISGVQQQGSGFGSVSFSSQLGTFDVSSLRELGPQQVAATPAAAPAPHHPGSFAAQSQYQSASAPQSHHQTFTTPQPITHHQTAAAPQPEPQQTSQSAPGAPADPAAIIAAIESLAGLYDRGILFDEEFASKKAELLARL
jgi:hypothetical protein